MELASPNPDSAPHWDSELPYYCKVDRCWYHWLKEPTLGWFRGAGTTAYEAIADAQRLIRQYPQTQHNSEGI